MTEIYEVAGIYMASESSKTKYSKDWKLEVFALLGFCASGVIFLISGIQSGDILTIAGSSVWILSCLVWMFTYRKYFFH